MIDHNGREGGWRLYFLNWVLLGVLALLLGFCLAVSSFSFEIESGLLAAVLTATTLIVWGHYMLLRQWGSRPAFILVSIAQRELLFLLASPLTYIAASADFPLQDATLARWDQLVGLDWTAYYHFITARPTLVQYAYFFYAMITWPTMGVPIVLGLTENYVRLQNFTRRASSLFVPADVPHGPGFGTYHQYGLPTDFSGFNATGYLVQLDRLPPVRDGTLRFSIFLILAALLHSQASTPLPRAGPVGLLGRVVDASSFFNNELGNANGNPFARRTLLRRCPSGSRLRRARNCCCQIDWGTILRGFWTDATRSGRSCFRYVSSERLSAVVTWETAGSRRAVAAGRNRNSSSEGSDFRSGSFATGSSR